MSTPDTQNNHFLILITKLFSAIITIGYIPTTWKKGLAIPVHKGGPTPSQKYESYRPIALLCSFSKLFETIIFSRIQYWIETFSIILPNKQQQVFTES
jgi:hypothetical protein